MKKSTVGYFLILIFVLFSCQKDSEPEELTCGNFEVNYDKVHSLSDIWETVAFISESGNEECVPLAYSNLMDIKFPSDTNFVANSTCNLFKGNISFISADEISIKGVNTTDVICIDDDFEYWDSKYFKELQRAKYVRIDGNKLTIHTFLNTKIVCKARE